MMASALAGPAVSDSDTDSECVVCIVPLDRSRGVGTGCPPPMFEKRADVSALATEGNTQVDFSDLELSWAEQPNEYHRARYPKELSKRGNCRGAIEGRNRGVPTIQLRGLLGQPNCPDEVDLTVYVSLPDGRRHPFFYCLTAGRDAPSSCQAFQLEDKTHALHLKARAEDNFVCPLKHVGIVRLRQEMLDTDKLGITFGDSPDVQDSPRQAVCAGEAKIGKARSPKPKPDALPSHNNYFRLFVVANIIQPNGSYMTSMSESIKCVSSTQLVQNPHITQILSASDSLIMESSDICRQPASQPELFVFGKDFASNTRIRVFQRLPDGRVWKSSFDAKDYSWLCGHHCCVKVTLPTPPPQLQQAGKPASVHMEVVIHTEKAPSSEVPLDWTNSTCFQYPSGPWPRSFNEKEIFDMPKTSPARRKTKCQKPPNPTANSVGEPSAKRAKVCTTETDTPRTLATSLPVPGKKASTTANKTDGSSSPAAHPKPQRRPRAQRASSKQSKQTASQPVAPLDGQGMHEQQAWSILQQALNGNGGGGDHRCPVAMQAVPAVPLFAGNMLCPGYMPGMFVDGSLSTTAALLPTNYSPAAAMQQQVKQLWMSESQVMQHHGLGVGGLSSGGGYETSGGGYETGQREAFHSMPSSMFSLPSPSCSASSLSCPDSPESVFNLDPSSMDFACPTTAFLSPLSDPSGSPLHGQSASLSGKSVVDLHQLSTSTLDEIALANDLMDLFPAMPMTSLAGTDSLPGSFLPDLCGSTAAPQNQIPASGADL